MKRRIATLTPEENKVWENAFGFYVESGNTDEQADQMAWRDIQKEFPRLKAFDGCKPEVA